MENWSGKGGAYRASFAGLCSGTIDEVLGVLAGGRLLDVGCGTGDLLAAAIDRGWAVEGVDPNPDMVTMSEARAPGRVRRAALPELPFDDGAFNAVTANFVVNHVADPRASMGELARVLAPGGRLAVTVWPAGGATWSGLIACAFADAGAVPLASTRLPEHLDFPRTGAGLAGIASEAGLEVREARDVEWVWRVSAADLWAGIEGGVATPGQTYLAQEPTVRAKTKLAFQARALAEIVDDQMAFPCRAVLVVASR